MKESNFNKLMNIAMDSNTDILDMFKETEISAINSGDNVFVAYATDEMFSGWGMSKNKLNHVFAICWNHQQAEAITYSFKLLKNMKRPNYLPLENFFNNYHRGTWSIKNANDCRAWNRGVIINR